MIQRYDVDYCTQHACTCEVVKDDEGGYVEYEDYVALEAKYSEVKSRVALEPKCGEVKTYAVNCNDAWINTEGDDTSGSYVKFADYAALEAKYSEAQRELVALRSQVRDASALVKQLHDVVATIGVDDEPSTSWTAWESNATNPVPAKMVMYKLRNGYESEAPVISNELRWEMMGLAKGTDIVAYRVVKSNDGDAWTVWHGGENPVPGKMVEFKMRNGERGNDQIHSSVLHWDHHGEAWDVVAYRVVKEG